MKVGDVVRLRPHRRLGDESLSPRMTVLKVLDVPKLVEVGWFIGARLQRNTVEIEHVEAAR